jgi:hypothetical protein
LKSARPKGKKPLWKCPKCGHRFVTRNLWHSCVRVSLASHFRGKDPIVRELFDRFRALVRRCGPATVYAQKTRIVFMTRARFAGAKAGKRFLDVGFWLKRRAESPRVRRVEHLPPHDYIHHVRLVRPSDVDSELASLLREAYAVGRQES